MNKSDITCCILQELKCKRPNVNLTGIKHVHVCMHYHEFNNYKNVFLSSSYVVVSSDALASPYAYCYKINPSTSMEVTFCVHSLCVYGVLFGLQSIALKLPLLEASES